MFKEGKFRIRKEKYQRQHGTKQKLQPNGLGPIKVPKEENKNSYIINLQCQGDGEIEDHHVL